MTIALLRCVVSVPALPAWQRWAVVQAHAMALAQRRRTAYDSNVPEKEGARLGHLNAQKRTDRAMRFFYVRMPSYVSYERRWRGSLRACWFSFVHQSSNPVICRSPRLDAGRGSTAQKEATMPSCTRTPEQSRTAAIQSISRRADTLAVLLVAQEFMAPADAQIAVAVCLEIANEVAGSLASIGGAA